MEEGEIKECLKNKKNTVFVYLLFTCVLFHIRNTFLSSQIFHVSFK